MSNALQATADLAFYTRKNLPQHTDLAVRAESQVRDLAELHENQRATIQRLQTQQTMDQHDISNLSNELAQLKKWKAELPALILDHLTSNDMSPCDTGLLSFMEAADLPMPNQERKVTITWSETATTTNSYSTTDTLDCEWDERTESYQPTQDEIHTAKSTHSDYNEPDNTITDYDHWNEDDTDYDVHDN